MKKKKRKMKYFALKQNYTQYIPYKVKRKNMYI